MQTPVKALLAVGCFTGVRGVGSGIRKVYLEQEEKSQDRAEGMGHFFLDGKKKSVVGKQRQSGGPHIGPLLRP